MKDKFLEFAKTPLGTAIAIGLFVLASIIYIVSKSKFGKKILFMVKEKVDFTIEKFTEHKEKTEKALKEQNEFLKSELEKSHQELTELKEFVCETLKSVNNKKVQESIKKFELSKISTEDEKVAQ